MSSILFNLTFNCMCSLPKKCVFLLVAMLFASSNLAHAEDSVPDKFRITLGGYSVFRYDGTMSLTDPDLGAGITISPEDTLGLDNEQTVLRLTGHYRFTKEHALTYSWYRISSQANKTLTEEFDWLDEDGNPITIPVGVKIDSSLDLNIFKVGYLWSFHHSDKVELALGAGLHVTRIAVGLHASTTSSGGEAEDIAVTVPLPVVSLALTYAITPKLSWAIKSEAFVLKYEDWEGLYTDVTLVMEYRVHKNVGLGIGLGSNSLKITEETPDHNFSFDNRITGVLIYAAAYF
jgi:hypothetical protein